MTVEPPVRRAAPDDAPAADALAALRVRARYDAAEPALHNAAHTAADPLAFLEAALDLLGRAAGAARARVLLADDAGAPLVTVAVWAAHGESRPEPEGLEAVHATTPVLLEGGGLLVPFHDDALTGAFVVERAADWSAGECDALARYARLFGTLWARAGIETRLRLTLADIEDGLFSFAYGLDDVRRYALVTPQLERIVGCAASDLLGRLTGPPPAIDWAHLVHPDDADLYEEHEAQLRAGDASRLVYRIRRPEDGETRWVRESATPGRSPSGRPVVGGLLADVTENKRAEASLLQAKQAAERASHAKTAFLAVMSHEIRSPLGAVRGFAELLGEELREYEATGAELPPQIPEFANTIAENTRRALHLVHRLFDLSRLETGSLALRSVAVELHPAIARVLARYGDEAAEKGVALRFEAADADPILVADPERVEEVVDHLVSNAVKFTEAGRVTVATYVEDGAVRLVVEDTGVGIDAAYLPGLFEPFSQEDFRLNRAHGGAGLGLAVARRLLDGMGGTITVESEKGRGSRFEVSFGRVDE